jgi:flagellar biogenesis protein FliO
MGARAEIMLRLLRLAALFVFATAVAEPLAAQSTPAPPDWKDNGSSVYLGTAEKSLPANDPAPSLASTVVNSAAATTSRKYDSSVVPSAHSGQIPPAESADRHLAPPGIRAGGESAIGSSGRGIAEPRRLMDFGIPTTSLYTMGTGLAIVVGAFLLFAWVLRRSGQGRVGRGMLPADAVSVLGRVPLSSKQVAQLLRVGNKLVLVALTPGGAETLTEVTDPVEVDRLMGLCQQHDPRSTTQAFEQVFQNLSREPVGSGFLGADSLPSSISPVAAAYRSHRGDGARA